MTAAGAAAGDATWLLSMLLLAVFAYLSIQEMPAPKPAMLNAPATEFSSARAFKHLEVIAAAGAISSIAASRQECPHADRRGWYASGAGLSTAAG